MIFLRIFLAGLGVAALAALGAMVCWREMEWNGDVPLSTPGEYAFVIVPLLLALAAILMGAGFLGALAAWLIERRATSARAN